MLRPLVRWLSRNSAKKFNLPVKMRHWEKLLSAAGVEDSRDSVRYIIAHAAFGLKTMEGVNMAKVNLNADQLKTIGDMIEKRRKRVPVQYILGEWDFRELTLKMRPPVLIPRPETEVLVERIIENSPEPETLLEVGCGSGAISLSLLRHFKNSRAVAIDCDDRACQLTRENARIHRLDDRLTVHYLTLDRASLSTSPLFRNKYDIIVSNPPYVRTNEIAQLQPEVRDHESWTALDGGQKGLDVTMLIMELAGRTLTQIGSLWLEVDSSHPSMISSEADEYNLRYVRSYSDFNDKPRFCQLKPR